MKLLVTIGKTGRLVDVMVAETGEPIEGVFEVTGQFPCETGGEVVLRLRRHKVEFRVDEES